MADQAKAMPPPTDGFNRLSISSNRAPPQPPRLPPSLPPRLPPSFSADLHGLAPPPTGAFNSYHVPRKSLPDLRVAAPSGPNAPTPSISHPPTFATPDYRPRSMVDASSGGLTPLTPISAQQMPPPNQLLTPTSAHVSSQDGANDVKRPAFRTRSSSDSRPLTPNMEAKIRNRRSFLPGHSSRGSETILDLTDKPPAWMLLIQGWAEYDLQPLIQFRQIPELWDPQGDTLVYLHGTPSRGPSFRVDSACFASSTKLVQTAFGETHSQPTGPTHTLKASRDLRRAVKADEMQSSSSAASSVIGPDESASNRSVSSAPFADDTGPAAKHKEVHLCLPQQLTTDMSSREARLTPDDVEHMVIARNLFALLNRKPLVATKRNSNSFDVLMQLSTVLHRYQFTNLDGTTLGEEPATNLKLFIDDYGIQDVRASREKTLDAIVLGERLKNRQLYNEGYVHAVGKYEELAQLKSSKQHLVSSLTRQRLERSHLSLATRLRSTREKFNEFSFPQVFAGFANSTSSSESKVIKFKAWKNSFLSMRRHFLAYYKQRYGSWPPKARSKKNTFEESGLNRLLLREMYTDLCDLYDVLVDRTNFTTRQTFTSTSNAAVSVSDNPYQAAPQALRRILEEYDRSTPPIQPPIPFDTPRLPTLSSTRRNFATLPLKQQRKDCSKRLDDSEINTALMQSYNRDLMKSTSFLTSFFDFERRSAHSKSIDDICDLRNGQWLFLYAAIQTLPPLVIDAPELYFTEGVEYFLSETPKEAPPWYPARDSRRKTTWRIPGSDAMVELPTAAVEHSNEAIYQRSHCWVVAHAWADQLNALHMPLPPNIEESVAGSYPTSTPPPVPDKDSPVPPILRPGSRPGSATHSRSPSRSPALSPADASFYTGRARRVSIGLGLEQLPLPPGINAATTLGDGGSLPGSRGSSRPSSTYDPNKSFSDILSGMEKEKNTSKKK